MVYAREIDNKTLTFIVSGKLWRDSLIMQDEETGTLWSHVTGEALDGPLKGKKLDVIAASHTRWDRWIARYPDGKVLTKDREYTASRYEQYFTDPERMGMFRANAAVEKLPGKTLIVGTSLGPYAAAARLADLEQAGAWRIVDSGKERFLFSVGPDGAPRAFRASVAGTLLAVKQTETGIRDESGSVWNVSDGRAISGKRAGAQLDELPATTAFWFAWIGFYPNSALAE